MIGEKIYIKLISTRRGLAGLLGLGCLLISFCLQAQEYSYAHYDVQHGLAGSVVYCGVEDKDGFLWFGTETGLSRFDGTHFTNFTTEDGLPDNEILGLLVDSRNRIWIQPFRGSISYYWKGKIYSAQNDSLLAKIPLSNNLLNISEDKAGNILMASYFNAYIITNQQQVVKVGNMHIGRGAMVSTGVRDNGRLAIVVNVSSLVCDLYEIEAATGNATRVPTPYSAIFQSSSCISPELETFCKADSFYFLSNAGHQRWSIKSPKDFKSFSLLNDSLCAVSGLNGSSIYNFRTGILLNSCMKGHNVNKVMIDSEGSYWFLSANSGVYRLGSFEFVNFNDPANIKGGGRLPVFTINPIHDNLFIGSDNCTLWKVDPKGARLEKVPLRVGAWHGRITSMIELTGKGLFLGTSTSIVYAWGTGMPEFGTTVLSIKSMEKFQQGILMAGHWGAYYVVKDTIQLIIQGRATAATSINDSIYVAGTDGVYVVGDYAQSSSMANKQPVIKARVCAMAATADGLLWMACSGDGLIGYERGKVIYSIRQKDGLTSNICRSLCVAGNDVWVGTDKGLNRVHFERGKYTITNFTSQDGLIGDIINAVYANGDNVYVGTPAGLTYFNAHHITLHSYCKLRITGIHTNGTDRTYEATDFIVPHKEHDLRFDYAGISYRSAGNIIYRYRLVGLNDSWQTTKETFLTYPSLPSGDYELQIVATNKFGVESELLRLPFNIEKVWWEETWFRILVVVAGFAAVWLFINQRIRRVRKQNDEKVQITNRITELEQMALKAQMNPHFIFNSLNSLQQYVIDKDVLGANKFITDFSRLIRQTLEISTRTTISVYEEVSFLTTYLELEKTKFEDKFGYKVKMAPGLNPADWHIPPMILQPYVENSIRHGVRSRKDRLGHVGVYFSLSKEHLVCVVEDNGIGRAEASRFKSQMAIEYQSKGMSLTAKRIEMLNREQQNPVLIDIEDLQDGEKAAGTRVTIKFPLEDVQGRRG